MVSTGLVTSGVLDFVVGGSVSVLGLLSESLLYDWVVDDVKPSVLGGGNETLGCMSVSMPSMLLVATVLWCDASERIFSDFTNSTCN